MGFDLTLYNYLKKNLRVCYKTTDNAETYIRCPICGDSKKDKLKARFYIHNQAPFRYYCFNCEAYGCINDRLLSDIINGNDSTLEISQYIKEKTIESHKNDKYRYSKRNKINAYFTNDLDFSTTKKESKKIKYLEDRLNIKLTEEDIVKFKIVLNLRDFISNNNLRISIKESELNLLCKKYIGFLSSDRNTIIFRNIYDDKNRYKNITLFSDFEGSKVYTINKDIDITKEYSLVISEGIIDIISIYKNIYENREDIDNFIFVANNGKSYSTSLNRLAELSIINYKNINIYSDKDVNKDFYEDLRNRSIILKFNEIIIRYNNFNGEKDFGVPKERIKLSNIIKL